MQGAGGKRRWVQVPWPRALSPSQENQLSSHLPQESPLQVPPLPFLSSWALPQKSLDTMLPPERGREHALPSLVPFHLCIRPPSGQMPTMAQIPEQISLTFGKLQAHRTSRIYTLLIENAASHMSISYSRGRTRVHKFSLTNPKDRNVWPWRKSLFQC